MGDSEARIQALEKEVSDLKKSVSSFGDKTSRRGKKNDGTKKTPTPYNLFVQKEIAKEKEEKGDKYDHRAAFGNAAKAWTAQKKTG